MPSTAPLHASILAAAFEIAESDPGDGAGNLSEDGRAAIAHLKELAGDPEALRAVIDGSDEEE